MVADSPDPWPEAWPLQNTTVRTISKTDRTIVPLTWQYGLPNAAPFSGREAPSAATAYWASSVIVADALLRKPRAIDDVYYLFYCGSGPKVSLND